MVGGLDKYDEAFMMNTRKDSSVKSQDILNKSRTSTPLRKRKNGGLK
jgi:hypothetical protein